MSRKFAMLTGLALLLLMASTLLWSLGWNVADNLLPRKWPAAQTPPGSPTSIVDRLEMSVVDTLASVRDAPTNMVDRPRDFAICLAPLAAVSVGLALVSAPTLGARDRPPTPRSMRASVVGAAVVAGFLSVGLLLVVADWCALVTDSIEVRGLTLVTHLWPVAAIWILSGLVWGLLLRSAGSHARPGAIDRTMRRLFAGSALELGLAAPTFAFALRRDSCFCSWGSWFGIMIGLTSVILLCGPWTLLLATRRARMQWLRGVCTECGYPIHGGSGSCPECGTPRPGTANRRR